MCLIYTYSAIDPKTPSGGGDDISRSTVYRSVVVSVFSFETTSFYVLSVILCY
jgi:hypothetical protein